MAVRSSAYVLLAVAIAVAAYVYNASGGWAFLGELFMGWLPAIFIGQLAVGIYTAPRLRNPADVALFILANLLFAATPFFRFDIGDGGAGWIAYDFITHRPPLTWHPVERAPAPMWNQILCLPAIAAWLALYLRLRRTDKLATA